MRNATRPKDISRFIAEDFSNATGGYSPNYGIVTPDILQASAVGDVQQAATALAPSLPINLTIQNTGGSNATCTIFNASNNLGATNNGNPTGISLLSGNTNITYTQVLYKTLSSPFEASFVRLSCTGNTAQCVQAWTLTSVNYEGQQVSTPIPNLGFVSPYQQQLGYVDLDFPFKIDDSTNVQFTVLTGSNIMTMYFYPKTVISPINTLVNGRPQANYSRPNVPTSFGYAPSILPVSPRNAGIVAGR